jgi:hypothetical protein
MLNNHNHKVDSKEQLRERMWESHENKLLKYQMKQTDIWYVFESHANTCYECFKVWCRECI